MLKKHFKLFDGCTCTELAVTPKNWKTGGKELLEKDWTIHYYFYDPTLKSDPKNANGKRIRLKGMNMLHFKKGGPLQNTFWNKLIGN